MASFVLAALEHVWTVLASLKVPGAVMGGLALAAWKRPRSTLDVDLLTSLADSEAPRIADALVAAGLVKRHPEPFRPLGTLKLIEFTYEPPGAFVAIHVDILFSDAEYYQQALARRVPHEIAPSGIQVDVLSCEDLVIHKLMAGRAIDRADVVALLQENRDTLDLSYLGEWAAQLGLSRELTDVWKDAAPGDETL